MRQSRDTALYAVLGKLPGKIKAYTVKDKDVKGRDVSFV